MCSASDSRTSAQGRGYRSGLRGRSGSRRSFPLSLAPTRAPATPGSDLVQDIPINLRERGTLVSIQQFAGGVASPGQVSANNSRERVARVFFQRGQQLINIILYGDGLAHTRIMHGWTHPVNGRLHTVPLTSAGVQHEGHRRALGGKSPVLPKEWPAKLGLLAQLLLDGQQAVVLGDALRAAGRAGLDLACARADGEIGYECVLRLA